MFHLNRILPKIQDLKDPLSGDEDKNNTTSPNIKKVSLKKSLSLNKKAESLKNKKASIRKRNSLVGSLPKINENGTPAKKVSGSKGVTLRRSSARSSIAENGCILPTRCFDMDVCGETVVVCEGENRLVTRSMAS